MPTRAKSSSLIEDESKDALGWVDVCKQVACFCSTVMGCERVASGDLPFGGDLEECQRLLDQTEEASNLSDHLDLAGIYDLRPALSSITSPGGNSNSNGLESYLSARQLEGVASSLTVLLEAKASVQNYRELSLLAEGINQTACSRVIRAVTDCISKGYLKDEASEALRETRSLRAENREALRAVVDEQAAIAFSKGASDSRGNTAVVRGRFCIGIKAGRSGDLPRGSVKLSQSQSGQTFYYEPAPAVPLNNGALELEEREKREETAILLALTRLISSCSEQIAQSLEAASSLDIAKARAMHGQWCGGVKPSLSHQPGVLHIPNAFHPLLLERSLPPLPDPPSMDDHRFDQGFGSAGEWETRRSMVKAGGPGRALGERPSPRPLDLRVPPSITVVAITGPNTGGKTVALKTAGLAALFSKSGLFIPISQGNQGATKPAQHQAQLAGAGARESTLVPPDSRVSVSFFDSVLADIGDAQSLQQSLSTFSGHIRRINGILSTATERSLVLLDEVGSGTDPVEGAALAQAILEKLAGQAGLCLATTHHSEIKEIDKEDGRFVNASMEFDIATLAPTYQLIWGQSGASNALDIASALGFDPVILREARSVAKEAALRRKNLPLHMEAVAASLERQLELAQIELDLLKKKRMASEEEAVSIRAEIEEVRKLETRVDASPRLIMREVRAYSSELQGAIDGFAAGTVSNEELEAMFAKLEGNIQPLIARFKGQSEGVIGEVVQKGDIVFVPKLQGEARVESVSGDIVVVVPSDPTLAMASVIGWGSKSKGQVFKYPRSEVQVVKKGPVAAPAGESMGES